MPTIVDLVRQLEFAAMKQHELHYMRKSSESSERERADACSWNVGCRLELLHAIGQERLAATAPLLAQIAAIEAELAIVEELNHQLREQNTAVDQACAQLEAQLAEARKDAERLDWLDEQNSELENDTWVVLGHDCTAEDDYKKYWVGADLRTAIDAVIAQESNRGSI